MKENTAVILVTCLFFACGITLIVLPQVDVIKTENSKNWTYFCASLLFLLGIGSAITLLLKKKMRR